MAFTWDASTATYFLNGSPVPPAQVRASAQAVANQAQANMARAALDFQQGAISFDLWFETMQAEIVNATAAATVLAHGGIENATNEGWLRAVENANKQLDFFASFAADVANGRYGLPPGAGMLNRCGLYAQASRSIYENERALTEATASGATEGARIRGDSDSCESCIAWSEDELGWLPLQELIENYPIGGGECLSRCHCIVVVR